MYAHTEIHWYHAHLSGNRGQVGLRVWYKQTQFCPLHSLGLSTCIVAGSSQLTSALFSSSNNPFSACFNEVGGTSSLPLHFQRHARAIKQSLLGSVGLLTPLPPTVTLSANMTPRMAE